MGRIKKEYMGGDAKVRIGLSDKIGEVDNKW